MKSVRALKSTNLADRRMEPTPFHFKRNHHTTRPHYSSIRYGNLSRQICDNVRSVRLWSLPIWQTGEWNLHPSILNAIITPLDPNTQRFLLITAPGSSVIAWDLWGSRVSDISSGTLGNGTRNLPSETPATKPLGHKISRCNHQYPLASPDSSVHTRDL